MSVSQVAPTAVWQGGGVLQVTGVPPTQVPPLQVSPDVQALLSLQVVPSGAFGFEQVPSVGLQVPARWHSSLAGQVTGFAPVHTPV